MEILRHDVFRVTRDADFTVSDEADDLLRAVEDELRRRRFGEVVRLEVGADMDPSCASCLVDWLEIEERAGLSTSRACSTWRPVGDPRHRRPQRPARSALDAGQPARPSRPRARRRPDVFAAMRARRPARAPPLRLVRRRASSGSCSQAVDDPDVLAIKMTVYRTSDDSALVPSLIEAAERGKQAVCLVELKARFDERRNIGWARALEEAGAHVVHGLPGLKTHAKALLVVRREARRRAPLRARRHRQLPREDRAALRGLRPVHRPTREITADVADLFNSLTGSAPPRRLPQGARRARAHARAGCSRRSSRRSRPHRARRGRADRA